MLRNLLIGLFSLCSTSLAADCNLFGFKAGYFYPLNGNFRSVYGRGVDLQLAYTGPFFGNILWEATVNYIHLYGTTELHEGSHAHIVPIGVGVKQFFSSYCGCDHYFAIGPRYYFARFNTDSAGSPCTVKGNGPGVFITLGTLWEVSDGFNLDLSIDWAWAKCHSHVSTSDNFLVSEDPHLGGLTFAGGLTWAF